MNPVYVCLFALFALGSSLRNPFVRREHDHKGSATSITGYPFVVSVSRPSYSNGSLLTTNGAILNSHWIITSASHIYNVSDYQVRAGSDDVGKGGQLLNVAKIIVHESYYGGYAYNVALLKTAQKIRFNRQAKPVRLTKYEPQAGNNYTVVGFDSQSSNVSVNSTGSGLHVAMAYIDPDHRNQTYSYSASRNHTTNVTDTYFYARTVGSNVFSGDLMVQYGQLYGCYIGGNSWNASAYTNIAALRTWIIQTIKRNSKWYELEGLYEN